MWAQYKLVFDLHINLLLQKKHILTQSPPRAVRGSWKIDREPKENKLGDRNEWVNNYDMFVISVMAPAH